MGQATIDASDTAQAVFHSLKFTVAPQDGALQLRIDMDYTIVSTRTKKTINATARPLGRNSP